MSSPSLTPPITSALVWRIAPSPCSACWKAHGSGLTRAIEERCYTPDEIETALRHAGFGELACYDAGDLGMGGQLGQGRTFFVAAKL